MADWKFYNKREWNKALESALEAKPFPPVYKVKRYGNATLSFGNNGQINVKTIDANCGIGLMYTVNLWAYNDVQKKELLKHTVALFDEAQYSRVLIGVTPSMQLDDILLEIGFKKIDEFYNRRYATEISKGTKCTIYKYDFV